MVPVDHSIQRGLGFSDMRNSFLSYSTTFHLFRPSVVHVHSIHSSESVELNVVLSKSRAYDMLFTKMRGTTRWL